jgi:hypothetical protein
LAVPVAARGAVASPLKADPTQFFCFEVFAGRADEDEFFLTHSKLWDRAKMLHRVAASGAHKDPRAVEDRACSTTGVDGVKYDKVNSLETGRSTIELSVTDACGVGPRPVMNHVTTLSMLPSASNDPPAAPFESKPLEPGAA